MSRFLLDFRKKPTPHDEQEPCFTNIKLLLLGESDVGKSSILQRFTKGHFNPDQESTVGAAFEAARVQICGHPLRALIWDTAGQERFRAIAPNYYRGAQAALVVYDITNKDSFRKIEEWLQALDDYSTHPDMVKMLIGNKIDKILLRAVSTEEGENLALKHRMMFLETSALLHEGVNEAFEGVLHEVVARPCLWRRLDSDLVQLETSSASTVCGRCR